MSGFCYAKCYGRLRCLFVFMSKSCSYRAIMLCVITTRSSRHGLVIMIKIKEKDDDGDGDDDSDYDDNDDEIDDDDDDGDDDDDDDDADDDGHIDMHDDVGTSGRRAWVAGTLLSQSGVVARLAQHLVPDLRDWAAGTRL